MMKISNISLHDHGQKEAWERYVQDRPRATFYHRIEWQGVMERNFGHETYYLMAEEGGEPTGILPMVYIDSRLFGKLLCSMPFLNFGGVVADNLETESALLEEAASLVRSLNVEYLELRHQQQSNGDLPVKTHKVSMTVQLDPDPEVVWQSYKSRHRTTLKKALRANLEYVTGRHEYLDDFYTILSRGWRNMGTPIYAKSFFRDVLDQFGESVCISMVTFQGRPIATALDGLHNGVMEGMWTYGRRKYAHLLPNYFLYWKLIKRACLLGCNTYHLGRSTVGSSNVAFKRKWRADPKQLYWEYILGNRKDCPALETSNPKYRLAIAAWRRMPLKLTHWLGPLVSRSIP